MRINKKFFNICIISIFISVVLIIVLRLIAQCFSEKIEFLEIFKDIFISLIGGAFFGAILSLIQFKSIERNYYIKFHSLSRDGMNLICALSTWIHNEEVKLKSFDENILEYNENELKALAEKLEFNKEILKKFCNIVVDLEEFSLYEMYSIMDDYCYFFTNKEGLHIEQTMYKMLKLIENLKASFIDKVTFSGYKSKIYDEQMMYEKFANKYREMNIKNILIDLDNLKKDLVNSCKINNYLRKRYKNLNDKKDAK